MKKLLLLIGLATLAFSCKKNQQEGKSPSNGTITGSLAPAGAFNVIYATDNLGRQFSGTVDPVTGAFKMDDLAAGKGRSCLQRSSHHWDIRWSALDEWPQG